ncbi:MAG TPA: hypothetical protein VI386_24940 [Candidatus Sulfotelmatobacter sp.]
MALPFQLEAVWDNEDFYVHKGVLDAQATLPGVELGDGMIYYAGVQKVKHRILSSLVAEQPVLGETGRGLRCVWNEGRFTEIVNEGTKPINLFRVGLTYDPELERAFSHDIAAATVHLVHGKWPHAFETSVGADLKAIGLLAKPFATGAQPSSKDVLRAKLAKEDLEFKLQWFAGASGKLGTPGSSGWGTRTSGKSGTRFYSLYSIAGPGGGWSAPSAPLDPIVNVTVNTKDSNGGDVRGCKVFANAYAHGDDENEAVTFSRMSTPTTEPLPVGRYKMWAARGNLKGPLDAIGVGRGNQRDQTVDLIAP